MGAIAVASISAMTIAVPEKSTARPAVPTAAAAAAAASRGESCSCSWVAVEDHQREAPAQPEPGQCRERDRDRVGVDGLVSREDREPPRMATRAWMPGP